jgi:hypothetical protein
MLEHLSILKERPNLYQSLRFGHKRQVRLLSVENIQHIVCFNIDQKK